MSVGAEPEATSLRGIDLSRTFRSRSRVVAAVEDVDIAVLEGESLGLVGPSGSGKSTLLSLLLGTERPDRGEVLFNGAPLVGRQQLREARQAVQFIPQDPASSLDPRRTVEHQLREPLRRFGIEGDHKSLVQDALEQVGLVTGYLGRRAHELSGGQAQRVAMARALVTRPRILLADEAVSGLDLPLRNQVLDLLKQLHARDGLGLLFISHDLTAIHQLCQRALVFDHGRVVEEGPTSELFYRPAHPTTQELVDAIPLLPA
ncbi:ABC transporter ATP-binding protein [Kocuria coralli]|uniref:ABC transporter ATP-binding protein n=1 Tax=Kocuria coralli TaxID=1461025 RepID=UPI001FE822F7|nr:ATP-binding cassette domain-containing protein [Kocuria coralli]